jgi:hypothetical protein
MNVARDVTMSDTVTTATLEAPTGRTLACRQGAGAPPILGSTTPVCIAASATAFHSLGMFQLGATSHRSATSMPGRAAATIRKIAHAAGRHIHCLM